MRLTSLNTALLVGLWWLSGCGAPTKSASSVASLFSTNATSLTLKEQTVCTDLANRTDAPSTQLIGFDLQGCQNSGLAALDYTKITAFEFADLTGDGPVVTSGSGTTAASPAAATTAAAGTTATSLALDSGTTTATVATTAAPTTTAATTSSGAGSSTGGAISSKSLRAEIWLNRSLLDLAGTLTQYMQQQTGTQAGKVIQLPNSATTSFANLVTPVITLAQAPKLDLSTLSFTMAINMKTSGLITIDNTFQVDGRLIDDAFAITIATSADQPYASSLVQSFKAVIIVIPYANDVYLDLFVDLNIYDVGLQSVFNQQLTTFLSTGLKAIIDSLILVQRSAG